MNYQDQIFKYPSSTNKVKVKTTCVPGVGDGVDRVAGGHQVYPRVEHRGRQANHRDAHREVQTGHEDARGPGVCTLRGLYDF